MADELEQPAPPYGNIRGLLRDGKVIPFLGAGVHLSNRPPKSRYKEIGTEHFLPSGSELANVFASEANFPAQKWCDRDDLAKVASYYAHSSGRELLNDQLRRVFNEPFALRSEHDIHQFLAENPVPLLVVTTNYDDSMERALDAVHKPYAVVVNPSDEIELRNSVLVWAPGSTKPEAVEPAKVDVDFKSTWVIYKMHGTVLSDDRAARLKSLEKPASAYDNFVITEEDYFEFLARMTEQRAIPAQFMQEFAQRRFLFLGYGLRDWNFRVVLHNLRKVLKKSWAIQHHPEVLERTLWDARGINIYNRSIEQFVKGMRGGE